MSILAPMPPLSKASRLRRLMSRPLATKPALALGGLLMILRNGVASPATVLHPTPAANHPRAQGSTVTPATVFTGPSLTGAGSGFAAPLYLKWIDDYDRLLGGQIYYLAVGSGVGIKQVTAGTVDFGASDVVPNARETARFTTSIAVIPMAAHAVALVYNLPSVHGLKLDDRTLANIYLGKVTMWNDPAIVKLNPWAKLPDVPITPVHRSDGSGTTFLFTTYLAQKSKTWATTIGSGKDVEWPTGIGARGNDGIASEVAHQVGSIGYLENRTVPPMDIKLQVARLKNKSGYFRTPCLQTTASAATSFGRALTRDLTVPILNGSSRADYPIAGFTYILVYKTTSDPARGKRMRAFLKWAVTAGQKDASPLGYVPLPKAVVAADQRLIERLR